MTRFSRRKFHRLNQQVPSFTPGEQPAEVWEDAPTHPAKRMNGRQIALFGVAIVVTAIVMRLVDTHIIAEAPGEEQPVIFGDTTSVWPPCWPDDCTGDFADLDVGQVNATIVESERYCIGGRASKWLEPVEYPAGMTTLVIKTQCVKGSSYGVR